MDIQRCGSTRRWKDGVWAPPRVLLYSSMCRACHDRRDQDIRRPGRIDHCTEFCVVTCYLLKMLYEKNDIRNNKTDIKKKKKKKKKKEKVKKKKGNAAYNFLVIASHKPG
jgi:hypothetical protein